MLVVPTSKLFSQFSQLFFRLLQDHMVVYLTELLPFFQVTSHRTKENCKTIRHYSLLKQILIWRSYIDYLSLFWIYTRLQKKKKTKAGKWEILFEKRESPKMKRAFQKWKQCTTEIILWRYVIPFQVYFFSTFHIWCTL